MKLSWGGIFFFNPYTLDADTGRMLAIQVQGKLFYTWVPGHLGVQSSALPQKKKGKNKEGE